MNCKRFRLAILSETFSCPISSANEIENEYRTTYILRNGGQHSDWLCFWQGICWERREAIAN